MRSTGSVRAIAWGVAVAALIFAASACGTRGLGVEAAGAGAGPTTIVDPAAAREAGAVARCADGSSSSNSEFDATCSGHGGSSAPLPVDHVPPTTTAPPTTVPPTALPTTATPVTAPPTTAVAVTQSAPIVRATPMTAVQAEAGSGCSPNYDPCVPMASDVDCAGGSGNGPAYVSGPVHVIGSDVYGLDGNDNDGIGCES